MTTKRITYGGRRYGRSHDLKVMAILDPSIRLLKLPDPPKLRGIGDAFGDKSWAEKLLCPPPGTELHIGHKVVWLDDDGYHERPVSDEQLYTGRKKP